MSTLSNEYREILTETHKQKKNWGTTGSGKFYKTILKLADTYKTEELLDYGAGVGNLKKSLAEDRPNLIVHEYEPARPEVSNLPEPCRFVVCNDVLEHVEPEYLDAVLEDLQRVVAYRGYFTVCMTPAVAKLSDGRNAHLIVKPWEWWVRKVSRYFHIREAYHLNRREPQGQFVVEKFYPLPDYHDPEDR